MVASKQFFKIINNPLSMAKTGQNIIEVERTWIGYVLNWIRLIGTGLAVIMLTYMALYYINVGPDKRAELRQRFRGYVIGIVVFLGATNIIYYLDILVEDLFKKIINY